MDIRIHFGDGEARTWIYPKEFQMLATLLNVIRKLLPNTNHSNTKLLMKILDGKIASKYLNNIQFNENSKKNVKKIHFRYDVVQKGPEVFTTNGLNSLKYHIKEIKHRIAFTSIVVDFVPEEVSFSSVDLQFD